MAAENILAWDRAVFVAKLMAGLEMDFARLLLSVIHKRDCKTRTTNPFFNPTVIEGCWIAH